MQPLSYTNWSPGEPNDAGGDEDCAVLRFDTFKWNDYICGGKIFYICQKPQGQKQLWILKPIYNRKYYLFFKT